MKLETVQLAVLDSQTGHINERVSLQWLTLIEEHDRITIPKTYLPS